MTQVAEQQQSNEVNSNEVNSNKIHSNEWEVKYPSIGLTLNCVLNTDKERIQSNIKENLKRNHPRVWPHKLQDTDVIICAGGPSLIDHIEEIKALQDKGGKVIALANVAHVLEKYGIIPNGHILLDAKPRNAEFITNADTTYFISSQCDPQVFENAEKTGNQIYIWHAVNNDDEFECINDIEEKWVPIQGGSTITMRAIRLFTILGYRNYHVFGWDSCYFEDVHHAYEQPDADKHKKFKFEFEGRTFTVSPWMISQALESINFFKTFCMSINLCVHGDGLISHIIKTCGKSTVKIS